MSINRVGILLGKELQHSTRSIIFIFATVIPVVVSLVVSLVFGRLFSSTPRLALLDEGESRLVELFMAQDYLDTRLYTDADTLRRDTENGVVEMGLLLPPGFDAALHTGAETSLTIYFWGEGAVLDRATLATALARNIVELTGRDVPVSIQPVTLGSGDITSWSERLLPLLVLMTIVLGGTLVPAGSLVDEKQRRTLQALTISPASLLEVLLAKALLGMGVSLAMGVIILTLNRAFGGQPALLVTALGLGAAAAATFGIILGMITKDINGLFTIIKAMGILLYAPALINMIPQLPQELAQIFPTYYIIAPIQRIALEGAGWGDVAGQLVILVALIALLLAGLMFIIRWQQQRQLLAA